MGEATGYVPFYLNQPLRSDIVSSLQSIISSCERINNQLDQMQFFLRSNPCTTPSYPVARSSYFQSVSLNEEGTVTNIICNADIEELYLLHQTSTVEAFHQQFETVRTLVAHTQAGLSEAYFTSLFINGLRPDVRTYVQHLHPITVIDAFYLACIYEFNFSSAQLAVRDFQWIEQPSIQVVLADEEDTASSSQVSLHAPVSVLTARSEDMSHATLCSIGLSSAGTTKHGLNMPGDSFGTKKQLVSNCLWNPIVSLEETMATPISTIGCLTLQPSLAPRIKSVMRIGSRQLGVSAHMIVPFVCQIGNHCVSNSVVTLCLGSSGWPPPDRCSYYKLDPAVNVVLSGEASDQSSIVAVLWTNFHRAILCYPSRWDSPCLTMMHSVLRKLLLANLDPMYLTMAFKGGTELLFPETITVTNDESRAAFVITASELQVSATHNSLVIAPAAVSLAAYLGLGALLRNGKPNGVHHLILQPPRHLLLPTIMHVLPVDDLYYKYVLSLEEKFAFGGVIFLGGGTKQVQ